MTNDAHELAMARGAEEALRQRTQRLLQRELESSQLLAQKAAGSTQSLEDTRAERQEARLRHLLLRQAGGARGGRG